MPSKPLVIVFAVRSLWAEPHRGRHHYATLLSERHRVLWVNRHLHPGEPEGKVGLERVSEGLQVLHAGWLPPFLRLIRRCRPLHLRHNLDNRLRVRLLRRTLNGLGSASPDVLWCYDFKGVPFVREYKNRAFCLYVCNDWFGDWSSRLGNWSVPRYEWNLARLADCVIAVSPKLQARFAAHNPRSYFVPHGTWPTAQRPEYVHKPKADTAAYVGTLNNTVDVSFLERILRETNLQLHLAGPIVEYADAQARAFEKLIQSRGVKYYGNLDRHKAEAVRAKVDLLLLPYKRNRVREYGFPIKYFEYLGTGKPIVATDCMEWPEPYNGFVHVYHGDSPLQVWLEDVYEQWDQSRFSDALSLAEQCTWEFRVQEIGKLTGLKL
jgi:glycosyltransferase involved in cell wall biosynthesis